MTHTIVIPNWRPTPLNRIIGSGWSRGRAKKADREFILAYAAQQAIPAATCKRRVNLHVTLGAAKGKKRRGIVRSVDPDSMWKSLLDGLVCAKLLINDTSQWCEPGIVTQSRGTVTETRIELVDIEAMGAAS